MKDEKTFGQRLRETRIRAGMSQSDLEELSGIPKARLSRYENGHVAPSIQTLERLAKALQVSEASLLGDQRAILEDFFKVLYERGVMIHTTEQARSMAEALADLVLAVSPPQAVPAMESTEATSSHSPAPVPAMASVREWLDGD